AVAVPNQASHHRRSDSIKHLKLEGIFGKVLVVGHPLNALDQTIIVRSNGDASLVSLNRIQQLFSKGKKVGVDIFLLWKRDVGWFPVSTLDQANTRRQRQQGFKIAASPIEIRLKAKTNVRILRSQPSVHLQRRVGVV